MYISIMYNKRWKFVKLTDRNLCSNSSCVNTLVIWTIYTAKVRHSSKEPKAN